MKKWVLKAIIQKFISFLPGSHRINFWFQKYVTKGVQLSDAYFNDKLVHAYDHLRLYAQNQKLRGIRTLELGTGWYPVVPIALYLAGAEKIVSVDLSPLMNLKAMQECVAKYQNWIRKALLSQFDPYWESERVKSFLALNPSKMDFESLKKELHLEYRVGDARELSDADQTFDLIHSNNVFEHIYPEVLKQILQEFKRVLKPEGKMSHFIDMSDHFAHLDSSISIYNFLRFDAETWQRIDNSVQPQNRWRYHDYQKLYQDLGFNITVAEKRAGEPEALQNLKLAEPYAQRAPEDLAISHVHLVNTL
jgi:SAM-dependent methyltransferase